MKKFLLPAILAVACAPVMASAANDDKKEEQCQKAVMTTLEALEAASERDGKEAKLKDLSGLDIMNIAKAKGACAAKEEISRREK